MALSGGVERSSGETLGESVARLRERTPPRDVTAGVQVMTAHIGGHPSQSSRIIKRSGQLFGFLQISPDGRDLVQRKESMPALKPKIDRELDVQGPATQVTQSINCVP